MIFSYNGNDYQIDNYAYLDKKSEGVYFEVKKCPKCRKLSRHDSAVCQHCSNPLDEDTICIAVRKKRTGLAVLLGAFIGGVVTTLLKMGANVRLGGIQTGLIVVGCYFLGTAITGRKIVVDQQATDDYKQYIANQNKGSSDETNISDSRPSFSLTRICKTCGKKTEEDSIYCSNCGKLMK